MTKVDVHKPRLLAGLTKPGKTRQPGDERPGSISSPDHMSYLQKRYGARVGVGGLEEIITNAANATGTALDIASDPYLPEVVCHMAQLKQIEIGNVPGECAPTAPGIPGGIGLRKAVAPLRAYVFAEQHTWVYPLAFLTLVGIPLLVGFELGKGSRS